MFISRQSVLLLILALAFYVNAPPPTLTSATRHTKTATVFGGEQRYDIYEMQFDQPLFYQENWPCPCNATCSRSVPAGSVNESSIVVVPLVRDQYYSYATNFTDVLHFKFDLNQADYAQCPIVIIEIQAIYGQMQLMVSVDTIPDITSYGFYKYQLQRDSLWACPGDPSYAWGTWYLTVQNTAPVTRHSAFRIRWQVLDAPNVCPTIPTTTAPGSSIALVDGVGARVALPLLLYQYFTFTLPSTCADFAVSARQMDRRVEGDLDLYVSLSDPFTSFETGYDWAAFINYDDALSLRSICSPNRTVYIAVQTWKGDAVDALIVATSTRFFITRPVVDLPPQALFNALAGATVRLECGDETLHCEFPAHIYCMEPMAPYQCCSPLMIIPPTDSANPLWPSLRAFRDLEFSRELPWTLPTASDGWGGNVAGKLTLAVLRDVRYGSELRRFVQNQAPNCTLTWRHNFGNAAGEPITKPVVFTPKPIPCDYDAFLVKQHRIRDLIEAMENSIDYNLLRMYHLQIEMLLISDTIMGCHQEMRKRLTNTAVITEPYANQAQCYTVRDSPEYNNDACCTYEPRFNNCCQANHNTTVSLDHSIVLESGSSICLIPECADRILRAWTDSAIAAVDRSAGCTSHWPDETSVTKQSTLLVDVIPACRTELLGFYDMRGVPCDTNMDCQYGAVCDLTRGKCVHNDSHVMRCISERLDTTLQQILFAQWGMIERATPLVLAAQLTQRFTVNACIGPQSMTFRDHWFWSPMASDCRDECSNLGLAPHCFELDERFCPIPSECPAASGTSCFRWWAFVSAAPTESARRTDCLSEYVCNWNSSITTASDCIGSGNTFSCILCDGDTCELLSNITTVAACNVTINILGSCSVTCPGGVSCSTEAACLAAGKCDSSVADGGCFAPFLVDFYGTPYCENPENFSPYGCRLELINTAVACGTTFTALWVGNSSAVTSEADCLKLPQNTVCMAADMGIITTMSPAVCTTCNNILKKTSEWKRGIWTPSKIRRSQWVARSWQPHRSFGPTIDYVALTAEVRAAVMSTLSLVFSSETTCRVIPTLTATAQLLCDCSTGTNGSSCYTIADNDSLSYRLATGRACPYVSTDIKDGAGTVTLHISPEAVPPATFCQTITLNRIPATRYQSGSAASKLSSEVFSERTVDNTFVIVTDDRGQIVSDGVNISWPFPSAMIGDVVICMTTLHTSITVDESSFPLRGIGRLDTSIGRVQVVATITSKDDDQWWCATLKTPSKGTYFAIQYTNKTTANNFASIIIATILYAVAAVAACIIQWWMRGRKWTVMTPIRYIALVTACFFSVLRCIYLIVNIVSPTTAGLGMLLLFEIATAFFYVIYTSVLFLWIRVLQITFLRTRHNTITYKGMVRIYLGVNILTVIGCVCFIIAYYTVADPAPLPCQANDIRPLFISRRRINVAYLMYLAVLSILSAVAYVVVGTLFLKRIISTPTIESRQPHGGHLKKNMQRVNILRMTIVLLITFGICFSIRCILMLWSAATSGRVSLLVFAMLEVIPLGALFYYLSPMGTRQTSGTQPTSTHSTRATMDITTLHEKFQPN